MKSWSLLTLVGADIFKPIKSSSMSGVQSLRSYVGVLIVKNLVLFMAFPEYISIKKIRMILYKNIILYVFLETSPSPLLS